METVGSRISRILFASEEMFSVAVTDSPKFSGLLLFIVLLIQKISRDIFHGCKAAFFREFKSPFECSSTIRDSIKTISLSPASLTLRNLDFQCKNAPEFLWIAF